MIMDFHLHSVAGERSWTTLIYALKNNELSLLGVLFQKAEEAKNIFHTIAELSGLRQVYMLNKQS